MPAHYDSTSVAISVWPLCCLGLALAYLHFGASSAATVRQAPAATATMPVGRAAA